MNYEMIKKMARERECGVGDLIAQCAQLDPFYTGCPNRTTWAEFAAEMAGRFPSATHPRRLHYMIQAQDPPIIAPDGKDYLNTKHYWVKIQAGVKDAKYKGLIESDRFADRRNDPPKIYLFEADTIAIRGGYGSVLSNGNRVAEATYG